MRLELLVSGQARQSLNFNGAQTLSQSRRVTGLLPYYGLSGRRFLEARQQLNIGPYSFLTMCMV